MQIGARRTAPALVGRDGERAEIERLLAGARDGQSGTLVVRGEAGIGKTSLLEHAAAHADGMLVLRAAGVQGESDLAFAGLYGLVRPILRFLSDLPDPQSAALTGALGLGASVGADRFLVSAAVLGLLAAAAEERPVLCLVDDAQWLDVPSADALVFAARRLLVDRVGMIFGAREGEPKRFMAPGLPELVLACLDEPAASALLDRHARDATAVVRGRLLADARGNPLALIELPAALTGEQLAGAAPLPEAIPLTPRLQAVFRAQIEQLPERAQTVLLIAAAEDTGELAVVLRAAAELELGEDALDPAEELDLIDTSGRTVVFRHPLVRSAVFETATLSRRRRAHAALATALIGEEHVDRRVWHQAMATLSADEEVASALEASARRAQRRVAHASAATAFLRSAELSVDNDRRTRRVAQAAQAAWDAGQPDRAREAIERVMPDAGGDVRADLLYLSGVIEARCGETRAAVTLLLDCADATTDTSLKLEALGEAVEAVLFAGDYARAVELGRHATQVKPGTNRDRFVVALLTALGAVAVGDHDRASHALRETVARAAELDDPRGLIWAASAVWAAPELLDAPGYANRAVELVRERGLVSLLPVALQYLASTQLAASRFDLAFASSEEGYRLAQDTGQLWGMSWHLATLAYVEALRGRLDLAREHADSVLAAGRSRGSPFLIALAQWRLGRFCLMAGQADEATGRLLAATSADTPESHPMVALRAVPDLVEAAVAAGCSSEVAERVERYRKWVTTWPSPVHTALYSRCRALLEPAATEACFREALATPGALPSYWCARTELLYGEWLRRERRRQDARRYLRAALERFRQLGAVPWEDRAASELRATGESARKRDPSTLDQLTPQELQIAGLVSEGLTNRQIAGQLFLSPRTVDYHLRKVYPKLGIASRTELVRQGLPQRTAS